MRTYLPALKDMRQQYPICLKAVVELESKQKTTPAAVGIGFGDVDFIYTEPFTDAHRLPAILAAGLDGLIAKHHITGVIIATEPRAHMPYALWAAAKKLHILLDKPISTYEQITGSPDLAALIYADFKQLLKSGANSIDFHERCLTMYADLSNIARRHMPVLTFETGDGSMTPDDIAARIYDTMHMMLPKTRHPKTHHTVSRQL
jgi:hypothetical protein